MTGGTLPRGPFTPGLKALKGEREGGRAPTCQDLPSSDRPSVAARDAIESSSLSKTPTCTKRSRRSRARSSSSLWAAGAVGRHLLSAAASGHVE